MLAKAGEGDRHIQTKMVSRTLNLTISETHFDIFFSRGTCSQAKEKAARHNVVDLLAHNILSILLSLLACAEFKRIFNVIHPAYMFDNAS